MTAHTDAPGDLVERLRWSGQDAFTKHYSLGMHQLHTEAAARIEELENLLSSKTAAHELAEARIEELEAALGKIHDFPYVGVQAGLAIRAIARAALSGASHER